MCSNQQLVNLVPHPGNIGSSQCKVLPVCFGECVQIIYDIPVSKGMWGMHEQYGWRDSKLKKLVQCVCGTEFICETRFEQVVKINVPASVYLFCCCLHDAGMFRSLDLYMNWVVLNYLFTEKKSDKLATKPDCGWVCLFGTNNWRRVGHDRE